MIRRFLLPVLAVAGILFAVYTVVKGQKPVVPAEPVAQPSAAPFRTYVAGAGIIEANTENIAVATVVPGVVTGISHKVGDAVRAGEPLFKLDDRILRAQLAANQAALDQAKKQLEKLRQAPRAEELPPLESQVKADEASLADMKDQLANYEAVTDSRAITQEEMNRRRHAVAVGEAKLKQSQANLALTKAGTWAPDLEIAQSAVAIAEATVKTTQTDLDRLIVRAPVDGQVLQVNLRLGEYAQAGPLSTPLMMMGSVTPLHVRVDVDENDAWRIRPNADAVAFVRGNRDLKATLRFVRIEPYVIPKKSLTGDTTERVDTRVLQILYAFDRGDLPVYVGQQMDVFIDAPPVNAATRP